MRSTALKRGLAGCAALTAGIGLLSLAPAAQAQSPAGNQTYTAPDVMVMAAGSDTTQQLMEDILALHDGEAYGAGTLHTYNLAAIPNGTKQVDGDDNCPQHAWTPGALQYSPPPAQWTAPAGSSAGRDYLAAQQTYPVGQRGCVDIARSSSGPRNNNATPVPDKATFEYYAYALDDVTWATPSMKAPTNLSRQNIQDIYGCQITDWSDPHLGTTIPASTPITGTPGTGTPGAIQRYLPQNGSGTRSFFLSAFGITSGMLSNVTCPAVKEITSVPAANTPFEENQGVNIDYADYDKAILPYSAAVWNYQYANKLNPTVDKRNGVRLGGFLTKPDAGSPVKALPVKWDGVAKRYKLDPVVVNESAVADSGATVDNTKQTYNGVRYVYNVLDSTNNIDGYGAAFSLVGFDNTSGGFLSPVCDGTHAGEIGSNYFLSLDSSNPNGRNAAGGVCRRVPTKQT